MTGRARALKRNRVHDAYSRVYNQPAAGNPDRRTNGALQRIAAQHWEKPRSKDIEQGNMARTLKTGNPDNGIREMFSSLQYPACRAWYAALFSSLMGYWMTYSGIGFFIYEITDSAAYLGYTGFAMGLPGLLFTLYGGVIADRMPRRRLILMMSAYFMVVVGVLALAAFSGGIQAWHILLFALVLGTGYTFNSSAIQAFVADLVDKKDLTNAIALNGMLFNSDQALAPALLGIMYANLGPAWSFAICSLLFVPTILILLRIKVPAAEIKAHSTTAFADLRDGVKYILNHKIISPLLLVMAIFSILEVFLVVLMPAWAVNVLGGDVRTNGLLLSMRGAGAIAGGLTVAAAGRRPIRGRLMTAGMLLMPVFMLLFALVRWMPLVAVLLFLEGWGFIVFSTAINTMIQSRVRGSMRGRVMSVYALIMFGGMPVGALIGGTIAEGWGEPAAVIAASAAMMVMAAWVWLRQPGLRSLA